jgi:tRNA-Thr(GGU) m(6)t(6)A37 methyltransferase TsaA
MSAVPPPADAGPPRPRDGEVTFELPPPNDAGLVFIGRIRTPFKTRRECPHNVRESTASATIELDPRYRAGLLDLDKFSHAILLYWMHEARRDLLRQVPGHLGRPRGTFALRSPVRPNPIALAVVEILAVDEEAGRLTVRTIDCVDGTPLLDIKPYFASTDAVPDARRP